MVVVELLLESWQAYHRDSRIDLSQSTHHSVLALTACILNVFFRILCVQDFTPSIMAPLGSRKP